MDLQQKLIQAGFKVDALKMALISENDTCIEEAFKVFEDSDVSSVLFVPKDINIRLKVRFICAQKSR